MSHWSDVPCAIWRGRLDKGGYGRRAVGHYGGSKLVHRFVWEMTRGLIPFGLEIDHLCRTPACHEPLHLEVVTHRVNGLRSTSPMAINARKTHCIRGHLLSGHNLYEPPKRPGQRHCRACKHPRTQPKEVS